MQRIKLLPKEISDKIAAGEVIEAPYSVVKELVENSIDAGATQIVVEIKNGGKDYIRVTDNGSGILKEDLKLSVYPHATSKIEKEEDLFNITTLGFRGEALSSIAAVSELSIMSKTDADLSGNVLKIEGGEIKSVEECAAENGTTIVVKNLFFNLPARRKFLKNNNKEAFDISSLVSKIAIANTSIRFRFINNGSIMFSTIGDNDLYKTILSVFGGGNTTKLLPVYAKIPSIVLDGYVSSPLDTKTNRNSQIFFVNGHLIESKILSRAVSDAYSDKVFAGRYPSVYLFIHIDPAMIDVNVHPKKNEIKFFDEDVIHDFIVDSLRKSLLNKESNALASDEIKKEKTGYPSEIPAKNIYLSDVSAKSDDLYIFNSLLKEKEDINICKHDIKHNLEQVIEQTASQMEIQTDVSSDYNPTEVVFSLLRPLNQIFTTYILATDDRDLYIIDQHAAHERVMYEFLSEQFEKKDKSSQILIMPIVMDLSSNQMITFKDNQSYLTKLGFVIEEFGVLTLNIKEIPTCMNLSEAEAFVYSFLDEAESFKNKFDSKKDYIISRSCKAAIKAHDKMSEIEILELFNSLDKCSNPYSCPHGRPTYLKISEYELEKMFKRK